MRDKTIAFIQKTVAVLLACLMVLCFLPVGLIPDRESSVQAGEVMSISPKMERYSDKSIKDGENAEISRSQWGYYRFELSKFANWDADEINSVRLSLAFLKGSGEKSNSVEVRIAKGTDLSFEEEVVATVHPQTRGANDNIVEVDITELVRKSVEDGAEDISLRVLGKTDVPLYIATDKFGDPMYRPALRAVVGGAEDNGDPTIARAELGEAVYVSQSDPDSSGAQLAEKNRALITGGGNETYLRFNVNEAAINGGVHRAVLSLNKLEESDSTVKIFCINNDEWTAESISYSKRPRGDENTAFSALSAPTRERGRISFDVTQAVCEARAQGIKSLTFRITGADEEIAFSGKAEPKNAPRLYLEASDDADVVCASEAALYALGDNGASFVTRKLPSEYSSESGSASIRWAEYNTDGESLNNQHIALNGEITRPRWFEGDAEVVAVAQIRSGRYKTERSFSLNIPAATAPDYENYKFDNYTDIGNADSEEEQKVEFSGLSGTKRRWINGRMFTYREAENGSVTVLNLACAPDAQNYITLKLWSGDNTEEGDFAVIAKEGGEPITLETPVKSAEAEGGFVYATYALPRELTRGRSYVTLRLLYQGGKATEPRGLYAAYITQTPSFEPKLFSSRGEKSVGEPLLGEGVMKFIDSLRRLADREEADGEMNEVLVPSGSLKMSIDFELEDIVFTGEANIAFSIDSVAGEAAVYQRLDYYDRYCDNCPVMNDGSVIAINYGDYKLVWNKSGEAAQLPYSALEMSGVYKELASSGYYTFLSEGELPDDSVIPEGTEAIDGKRMTVPPERILLFAKLTDPMEEPGWRISRINGRSVTEISLADGQKIQNVTIKSVGGIADRAESVTVMLSVYEGEKIEGIVQESVALVGGTDVYTIDFSKHGIYGKSGMTIRAFVFDNTEKITDISPKMELQ